MSAAKTILLATIVSLAGCGSNDSAERYVNKEQGYSVELPDGWRASIVRGAAQFAPPKAAKHEKHTIVVRSVATPWELKEGTPATSEDIIAATAKVLGAMPRAKLAGRSEVEGGELHGVRFSVTFAPRGLATRYRREHALLFGTKSKHLFHVMYTAPATEPIDEAAFKKMMTTLSEEG